MNISLNSVQSCFSGFVAQMLAYKTSENVVISTLAKIILTKYAASVLAFSSTIFLAKLVILNIQDAKEIEDAELIGKFLVPELVVKDPNKLRFMAKCQTVAILGLIVFGVINLVV